MTKDQATASLNPCRKCQGKPAILYEPGSSYTKCWLKEEECPCIERAPDMELDLLVRRINEKNVESIHPESKPNSHE
jgi:hypothetical protein